MKNRKILYNNQKFKYPKDFELAFRPTKWSIRAFMNFYRMLDHQERSTFLELTISVLKENYLDRDTIKFIRTVISKTNQLKQPFSAPGKDNSESDHKIKLGKGNKRYSKEGLIDSFADMKINGIIDCNWEELADFIDNGFDIKYSRSTILAKLHQAKGERE